MTSFVDDAASPSRSLESETLNNSIVRMLRDGDAQAVSLLVRFGVRPDKPVDYVLPDGTSARDTAWGWSHQSATDDCARAWWPWVDRIIASQPPREAAHFLRKCLDQACSSAMASNSAAAMVYTWSAAARWFDDPAVPGVTRASAMNIAMQCLATAAYQHDSPADVAAAMFAAGAWRASDLSAPARAAYPQDPLAAAVNAPAPQVVEVLLAAGAAATPADRRSLCHMLDGALDRCAFCLASGQGRRLPSLAAVAQSLLSHKVMWSHGRNVEGLLDAARAADPPLPELCAQISAAVMRTAARSAPRARGRAAGM